MKTRGLSIALTLALAFASSAATYGQTSTPSPAPNAASASDAQTLARAKEWLRRCQTGDIDRSQLDDQMNALLTPDLVKRLSAGLGMLGEPTSFTYMGQQSDSGNVAYVYRVTFKSVQMNEIFALNKAGKVSGLQFSRAP